MRSRFPLFRWVQCLVLVLALHAWGQGEPADTQEDPVQADKDSGQTSGGDLSRDVIHVRREGQVLSPAGMISEDALPATPPDLRPERPERPDLPPSVTAQLERFRESSRWYLARQQLLKKRMLGANDREREMLRRQLLELRAEFDDLLRQRRLELRDRAATLREKLPNHKEVIDSIREEARDNLRGTIEENRTRRGTD